MKKVRCVLHLGDRDICRPRLSQTAKYEHSKLPHTLSTHTNTYEHVLLTWKIQKTFFCFSVNFMQPWTPYATGAHLNMHHQAKAGKHKGNIRVYAFIEGTLQHLWPLVVIQDNVFANFTEKERQTKARSHWHYQLPSPHAFYSQSQTRNPPHLLKPLLCSSPERD